MSGDRVFNPFGEAPEQSLRDLMGLLALPALWPGRDGQTIVKLMAQAIESVVALQICYVDLPLLRDQPSFVRLRLYGRDVSDGDIKDWREAIDEWHGLPIGTRVAWCGTPIGPVRMIRLSMGFSSGQGSVWFGATESTFPTVSQIALLRAATSLAATGIVAARAAHEREEANRAKDEFLAMLGHELRNPLAPITTSLALIRRERGNVPEKYHDIIERQVEHLSRLVEDLLDVSRITRGKILLQREPLRIASIITRAVEAVSPLIAQRKQTLVVDISDDGLLIFADLTRMTQAFSNLLNNAAKYTQPGGQIRIEAHVAESRLTIAVIDNGAGISAELMPKLFRIFEQGRVTIDRSDGGLGIGLALVKNLVELHGGQVHAKSDGMGCGATFTIALPVATSIELSDALSADVTHSPSAGVTGGVRVLLVDDNVDGLLAMEAFLSEMGFVVATATDGARALDLAEQFRPDVAVLDIGLPGMNGYELAVALHTQPLHADLPLFALTGYGQADDLARAAKAGFTRHFVKPVSLFELVEAVNASVAHRVV
ncbi:hybrid sensor histidine kinase/response regulator [Robbsia andropogonis]|uniref:hybrid sensor histidine kinase/response regulator n=1 Tax=Robbsia andropogonis TaxID=28092 RepID=UPI0004644F23|nr:ATP-binding protein [Robbsia andropogonis]MCP1119432.1 ATP-binding protein [Robbsia andropogonis]MCP1129415.1 ATP-binding protein [Robbsia andropogonis]